MLTFKDDSIHGGFSLDSQMKNPATLSSRLKVRRVELGLTQRSLAAKLGVEASHIAFIEGGRRRPSLNLIAKMADTLYLERQDLFLLAHPEAKELINQPKPEMVKGTARSWRRFINNEVVLGRYNVTERELRALEQLSRLGNIRSTKHFLAILMLIREIPTAG